MPKVNQIVRTELTANQSVDNVFAGSKLENVPTDANYLVRAWAVADSFNVEMQIEADTDVLFQRSIVGDTLRRPQDPEDFIGEWGVTGGSKLFCKVDETGGTAQEHIIKVELIPM